MYPDRWFLLLSVLEETLWHFLGRVPGQETLPRKSIIRITGGPPAIMSPRCYIIHLSKHLKRSNKLNSASCDWKEEVTRPQREKITSENIITENHSVWVNVCHTLNVRIRDIQHRCWSWTWTSSKHWNVSHHTYCLKENAHFNFPLSTHLTRASATRKNRR